MTKLTIVIDHVRIEHAEADIIPDEDGIPTVAQAFTPRPDEPGQLGLERRAPLRPRLVPTVEIGQGFARARCVGGPTLETEIGGVRGSVLAHAERRGHRRRALRPW